MAIQSAMGGGRKQVSLAILAIGCCLTLFGPVGAAEANPTEQPNLTKKQALAPPPCVRVPLTANLPRASVGVQNPAGTEILLAAFAQQTLVRVSLEGEILEEILRPGEGTPRFHRVAAIRSLEDGYLVRAGMDQLLWLDSKEQLRKSLDFRSGQGSADMPEGVRFLFLADAVPADDNLLAYGFLALDGEKKNRRRVFRLSSGDPPELAEIIDEVPWNSPGTKLQDLPLPVLAEAPGGVYMLRFAERPFLLRVHPKKERLHAFPSGFEELASLPESSGPSDDVIRSRALERAAMPMALFGGPKDLFLLTRRPLPDATTRWQISRIDPLEDRLVGTLDLPSSAAHLLAIPGPKTWVFLEKGPRLSPTDQTTLGLMRVATSLIEGVSGTANAVACN